MIEGGIIQGGIIQGGWDYVVPAYAIALSALAALVIAVALHTRRWAKRAKALEQDKRA